MEDVEVAIAVVVVLEPLLVLLLSGLGALSDNTPENAQSFVDR